MGTYVDQFYPDHPFPGLLRRVWAYNGELIHVEWFALKRAG